MDYVEIRASAIEAASRVYEGAGRDVYVPSVISMAAEFEKYISRGKNG